MSNHPISDTDTPDPWMVAAHNRFYLTFTAGDRVEVWMSPHMEDFRGCAKSVIWKPEPGTPWSVGIWAPELHYLQGTWYVYFCGEHPEQGNASHRTLVLRSRSQDPMDAQAWSFLGPLRGLPDHWNIDATVFSIQEQLHQQQQQKERLFCCYSGWPLNDNSDTQQDLFLIELATPEEAIPSTLTCISRAELPWERPEGGRRGVNEGPTWLEIPPNTNTNTMAGNQPGPGFRGIVYSANGSWTSDYKLGVLYLVDPSDPLQPSSWRKRPTPLLESDRRQGGPFGPGHASFIVVPPPNPPSSPATQPNENRGGRGDPQIYCIYHATANEGEGWNNRKARVLCLHPEHFHPHARPVCCGNPPASARGSNNATASPMSGGTSWGQYPGNMSAQPQASVGGTQRKSLLDKIGDRVLRTLKEL